MAIHVILLAADNMRNITRAEKRSTNWTIRISETSFVFLCTYYWYKSCDRTITMYFILVSCLSCLSWSCFHLLQHRIETNERLLSFRQVADTNVLLRS